MSKQWEGISKTAREVDPASLRVVVVGAGPAGLTAAYQLAKAGVAPLVLEADPRYVGGLSRTVAHGGYHFDIGGHRFFSKSRVVEDLWTELLPRDMLVRSRRSRLYYDRRFLSYPLRPAEVLLRLGPVEPVRCLASYLQARLRPDPDPQSLEKWLVNRFGSRLYDIFFRDYTRKVWGVSGREISAGWAAQRIDGMSLARAVLNGLRRVGGAGPQVKTLIEQYRYPRRGPGMLWDACAARVTERGGSVLMGRRCSRLRLDGGRWWVHHVGSDGGDERVEQADHVVNSGGLRETVALLDPPLPAEARAAAEGLRYRDFLTVALIMRDRGLIDADWVYIQDKGVKVARVQNFKAWSPEMVPDPNTCCYGLEYFCNEGDALWRAPDAELIELAQRELGWLRLGEPEDLLDACVVRQPKAYPVYDRTWAGKVEVVRGALAARCSGLHQVGRGGMHRYNNQDHAMMTAVLTAQNILAGRQLRDPWQVNQDAEYVEAGTAGEQTEI